MRTILFLLLIFTFTNSCFSQKTEKFDRYSNFNSLGLPQVIEKSCDKFDSISGFKEELKYNLIGKIIERKIYSKINREISIETLKYDYDTVGNVIEISRSNKPKVPYPIFVAGGLPIYENEKFKYVYNKHGIWIRKYTIVDGKVIVTEKRKFK